MRGRRTAPAPAPAVVLQASGPNALGIIRSLGREGVPVIACDAGDVAVWAADDAGIRVVEGTAEALGRALAR